jgi:DNA-binding MarR family transcriptional regulator
MEDQRLPIGYYVKQVDKLFTEKLNAVMLEFGLTRPSWQILNSINERGVAKKDELISLMLQLTDKQTIDTILTQFITIGIANSKDESTIYLTEKGKVLFKDCSKKQNEFRLQVMQHVSEQDYQTTILTLEQIINNLG